MTVPQSVHHWLTTAVVLSGLFAASASTNWLTTIDPGKQNTIENEKNNRRINLQMIIASAIENENSVGNS